MGFPTSLFDLVEETLEGCQLKVEKDNGDGTYIVRKTN